MLQFQMGNFMPRKPWIHFPGAFYHCFNRGINWGSGLDYRTDLGIENSKLS